MKLRRIVYQYYPISKKKKKNPVIQYNFIIFFTLKFGDVIWKLFLA